MNDFEMIFRFEPREYTPPLELGDHPEIDVLTELDVTRVKKYQTIIGCLQWAVLLGDLTNKQQL
jgi:hypothetical protein